MEKSKATISHFDWGEQGEEYVPVRRRKSYVEIRGANSWGHDGQRNRYLMKLDIRPLTADLWPAFEDLFGKNGACSGCWCMYWRIGAAYRKRPREKNRAAFRRIVKSGPPPGLLAFDGNVAVGWCQLTPRSALPWLGRQWPLKRVDDVPVWALSCFYVRICFDLLTRWIQNSRLPRPAATDHASRSEDHMIRVRMGTFSHVRIPFCLQAFPQMCSCVLT